MYASQAIPVVGPIVRNVQSVFPSSIIVLKRIMLTALNRILDLVACFHRSILGPYSETRFELFHVEV